MMNLTFSILAWMPGPTELIVIGILGLLIFGKRLPEVGKSLGKSIVEFKKGLRGIEEDLDKSTNQSDPDMLPPPEPQEKVAKPEQDPVSQTNSTENSS